MAVIQEDDKLQHLIIIPAKPTWNNAFEIKGCLKDRKSGEYTFNTSLYYSSRTKLCLLYNLYEVRENLTTPKTTGHPTCQQWLWLGCSEPFFPQAYQWDMASSPKIFCLHLHLPALQRASQQICGSPATAVHQMHLRMQKIDKKSCGWDAGLRVRRVWCCSSTARDLPGRVGELSPPPHAPLPLFASSI